MSRDNTRMVDLPWVDGTTRTVPKGTAYEAVNDFVYFAQDGGYSSILTPEAKSGEWIYPHRKGSAAVRIFTEAPEPPDKVNVPTSLGAIVSLTVPPHDPAYVLTRNGWLGLSSGIEYDPSEIAARLRDGARVLFEGGSEDTP